MGSIWEMSVRGDGDSLDHGWRTLEEETREVCVCVCVCGRVVYMVAQVGLMWLLLSVHRLFQLPKY